MKRMTTLAVCALLAAGCVDLGLDANTPEAEARRAPPSELLAAVTAHEDGGSLIVDGREWVAAGTPLPLADETLTPVGSAGGHTVHARQWDRRPYDALYVRTDPEPDPLGLRPWPWQTFVPVLGGDGAGGAHSEAEPHAREPGPAEPGMSETTDAEPEPGH